MKGRKSRTADITDISLPLDISTPIWPGSRGMTLHWDKRLEKGDGCNNSRLECDVHVGTHVDAPMHFLEGGLAVDQLSLDVFVGPAVVAFLPSVEAITPGDLSGLDLPSGVKRLLLRTKNSALWGTGVKAFQKDFVALTADASQWLVDQDIALIGVDYLSVQRYGDTSRTHQVLLEANVAIVEGLNLANVRPGMYELICLPIRLVGAEGAPARVVLRDIPTDEDQ
jgi:arylformamidase